MSDRELENFPTWSLFNTLSDILFHLEKNPFSQFFILNAQIETVRTILLREENFLSSFSLILQKLNNEREEQEFFVCLMDDLYFWNFFLQELSKYFQLIFFSSSLHDRFALLEEWHTETKFLENAFEDNELESVLYEMFFEAIFKEEGCCFEVLQIILGFLPRDKRAQFLAGTHLYNVIKEWPIDKKKIKAIVELIPIKYVDLFSQYLEVMETIEKEIKNGVSNEFIFLQGAVDRVFSQCLDPETWGFLSEVNEVDLFLEQLQQKKTQFGFFVKEELSSKLESAILKFLSKVGGTINISKKQILF